MLFFVLSKPVNTVNSRLSDTPLLRTFAIADKIQIPGRRGLTGSDSRYYGLSLFIQTRNDDPRVSATTRVDCRENTETSELPFSVQQSFVNTAIYTLLDGLTYNTRGYFASCIVYEQRAKCPHVLYVKSSNKEFIIPLFFHFLVFYFLVFEMQLPSSANLIKLTEASANDENKTA